MNRRLSRLLISLLLVTATLLSGCSCLQYQDCLHVFVVDDGTGELVSGVVPVFISDGRIRVGGGQSSATRSPANFPVGCEGQWTITIEYPGYERLVHQHTAANERQQCVYLTQTIELRLRPLRP